MKKVFILILGLFCAVCLTACVQPLSNENVKMTEAEWDTAFSDEAFSDFALEITSSYDGETLSSLSGKIQTEETYTRIYTKINAGEGVLENYYEILADKTFYYLKDANGAWIRTVGEYSADVLLYYKDIFAGSYGDFTFDETENKYTAAQIEYASGVGAAADDTETFYDVALYFEHNTLVRAVFEVAMSDTSAERATMQMTCSEYGSTQIALPQTAVPFTVTEESFNLALRADNYTLNSQIAYESGNTYTGLLLRDGDKYLLQENKNGAESDPENTRYYGYLKKENGTLRYLAINDLDAVWTDTGKSSVGAISPDYFPFYDSVFSLPFSSFTAEADTLTATQALLDTLSQNSVTISELSVVFDENGFKSIRAEASYPSGTALTLTYTFSDFNATAIGVPD